MELTCTGDDSRREEGGPKTSDMTGGDGIGEATAAAISTRARTGQVRRHREPSASFHLGQSSSQVYLMAVARGSRRFRTCLNIPSQIGRQGR